MIGLFTGLMAQLLHIALVATVAPSLVGVLHWLEARLAGRVGPSVMQPWRDLIRLLRKETVLAESASGVSSVAPVIGAIATAIAACLVPSFILGMTFAQFADLLVIAGLLATARSSIALAQMDTGTALGGRDASRTMLLACLSEPALLLVVFVLGLLAGSVNLDTISAMQVENGNNWQGALGFAFAATLLVALIDTTRLQPQGKDFSGPDLALIDATGTLRLLVWFNLIGATFLPFGMATSDAGPVAWAVGLICWLARTALFVVALAVLRSVIGRIGLAGSARMLGIAMMLSLLAAVFLFGAVGAA
jgi:formate hydrogenlyase subunit 4